MFYGVSLLFCTYKEGTVIREQLVAGEKKRVPKQEYTVLLKVSCGDMDREGSCRRSFRLDLLSLSGTEGDMVPSLEYEWQAHAVRRAEAVSDMISEGMEMGLPSLLSE